jgi:hypothetical protein
MDHGAESMKIKASAMKGMAAVTMVAASVLLLAVPAARAADRQGGEHFAARAPMARGGAHFAAPPQRFGGPVARGGMHFAAPPQRFAGPAPRGQMRFAPAAHRFGGPPAQMHFAAAPHYEDHFGGGRPDWSHDGGDHRDWGRDGGDHRDWGHDGGDHRDWGDEHHFWGGPRYAVPHWSGLHPDWDDGRAPGYWVRPWGPEWEPHYWGGGDWDGRFWPHVYLDWDFPWFLAGLPAGYATYWWGGVPYYYWRGVYYVWSPDYGQYVVTDPPPLTGGAVEGAAPPPSAQADGSDGRGAMSLYVYPKNGQSKQQTENDRYQCHEWAVGQTGFDPINPANDTHASTATPANYKRAVTACLEARGYSVR